MKKKYLPILGIIWLTALASFIWGASMVYYDIFPAQFLKPSSNRIIGFWRGHPADKRSRVQRLWDELVFNLFTFAVYPPFPCNSGLNR